MIIKSKSTGKDISKTIVNKYNEIVKEIAEDIRNFQGKTIRSYDDAMKSLQKIIENPSMKIKSSDKDAIVNALKGFDAKDMADKVGKLGRSFNVAGLILKVDTVRQKFIEGIKTGNWGPLVLEVESWVLSGIASTIALGVFSAALAPWLLAAGMTTTAVTVAGIIVVAFLASLIDAKVAEKINNELLKPAF